MPTDPRIYIDANIDANATKPRGGKPKVAFSPDDDGWSPEMNEKQWDFYWDDSPYCLAYGERFSGKCLDINTLVYTDGGLVRLRELRPDHVGDDHVGRIDIGVFNESGPAKASAYWDEPCQDAIEVELDNGMRQAVSPRHRFWSEDAGRIGWTRATDIHEDIWLPLYPCEQFPSAWVELSHGEWNHSLEPDLAYALGVLVGDGCLGNKFVGLTTADSEIVDQIACIVEMYGCRLGHRVDYDYAVLSNGKPNFFNSLIKALRLNCGSKSKRIPAEILRSPRSVISAFLRGLYDADGTINANGTISLSSASEGLIDDTQAVLTALGVFSVKRPKRESWNLYSSGHASDEFMEHVGFGLSRKRNRYTKRLRNPHRGFYPPSIKDRWKEVVAENLNGYRSTRHDQSGVTIRDRKWHAKHRSTIQCRDIPRPEKVERLCELFNCHERFADYTAPLRWVKVAKVRSVKRKLADISVPDGERFLAGGMLHHNTYIGLDKMVRHCYQYDNALAILVVLIKTSANAGGAWEQLQSDIDDHAGRPWGTLRKWNEAVGLRYTEEYGDTAKNKWIDIETVHGGTSSILLLSMPYGANIASRIKNMTPSYFHFEELANADSRTYFTKPIQQLGRRPGIPPKAQQYVGTCNPADEGEKSWTFKDFFVHKPTNPRGGAQPGYDPKGYNPYTKKYEGWNHKFGVHHLPSNLNVYVEDMEDYQAKVMEETREDPTAYDRLIKGLWVAKITGDALFKHSYEPQIHLKGEAGKTGLLPIRGWPIIIGYDPGDANNARAFMQRVWFRSRWHWRVFDCMANFNEHVSYEDLIREQFNKMLFWRKRMNEDFAFDHVGDKAVFTHFNPQGSYDYLVFERISRELIEHNPDKYGQLTPIRFKAPEKGDGSVGERVRCVRNQLRQETLTVSALAPEVDDMFRYLKKAKGPGGVEIDDKPMKTKKGHIHMFDAVSYPIYLYDSKPVHLEDLEETELECGVF